MNPADFREPKREPKLEPGTESKPPLMTQNGGAAAGMMMHQTPMYPAGYQMPPGYPSAPSTPGPLGSAPPPTMMYPSAPTPSLMQPNYPHGFASGSSTPVNSNARSPARSRKAQQGMDNASAWLGHQHPHLAPPGTPGPGSPYGSRAPSVMSGMSMMTGINDDAVSVMSGVSLVELQPVTSHQTENIDPVRLGATMEEMRKCAQHLIGEHALPAASKLNDLLSRTNVSRFPKEVQQEIIAQTLYSLSVHAERSEPVQAKLFSILHKLADTRQTRAAICHIAQASKLFEAMVAITFQASAMNKNAFIRSIAFLNSLVRDNCEYSKAIVACINKEYFCHVFMQMINIQSSVSVEFVVRILQMGNRRVFREKITEERIRYLIQGVENHEGLLKRWLRKQDNTQIHNSLKIIELLVRNDAARQSPQEDLIQKWVIESNVLQYIFHITTSGNINMNLLDTSLHIIAALAGSNHMSEEMAWQIAQLMVSPVCVERTEWKLQNAIIHTLAILTAKRAVLQQRLIGSQAFNFACHLISNYAKRGELEQSIARTGMLESALDYSVRCLQLALPPEEAAKLWTEDGELSQLTSILLKPEYAMPVVSGLLNIIVSGSTNVTLKTKAVQTIGLALSHSLAASRFVSVLYKAVDEIRNEGVLDALVKAINSQMMAITASTTAPANAVVTFLRAAVDLLMIIIEEPTQAARLVEYAKLNASQFPINLLICPIFEKDERLIKNLLLICKKLVEFPELQQSWAQHRDHFNNLSMSGYFEIPPLATDILGMLGTEGDNDFAMQIGNTFGAIR